MDARSTPVKVPSGRADSQNMRRTRAIPLLCLVGLVAGAPVAEAKKPRPKVKSVTPLAVSVGEVMTIQGRNFTPGHGENMVVLIRGKRVRYVRSENSTTDTITIVIPKKIERLLKKENGTRVATRFRVKVITTRMGRPSRRRMAKPSIGPDVGGDCDNDGVPNPSDNDDDNDLLPDSLEKTARTNPCVADSDGDGLLDGWEFMSALDLNRNALPYPGKKPYPNALWADQHVDYDGDGLSALNEHAMWWLGGRKYPIDYSDGDQKTDPQPVGPNRWNDVDGDGVLADDERDFDNDGLANAIELLSPEFEPWTPAFPATDRPDFLDRDSDGDGLADGYDDQDHDGVSNIDEYARGTWAMNPCDPMLRAGRTCPKWLDPANAPKKPKYLPYTTTEQPIPWYAG